MTIRKQFGDNWCYSPSHDSTQLAVVRCLPVKTVFWAGICRELGTLCVLHCAGRVQQTWREGGQRTSRLAWAYPAGPWQEETQGCHDISTEKWLYQSIRVGSPSERISSTKLVTLWSEYGTMYMCTASSVDAIFILILPTEIPVYSNQNPFYSQQMFTSSAKCGLIRMSWSLLP